MSRAEDLIALADRCEREGASRDLDVDVLVAAGVLTPHDDPNDAGRLFKRGHYVVALIPWWSVTADGSPVHEVEPVTSSLDAAVAFVERVLPGWIVTIQYGGVGSKPMASVEPATSAFLADAGGQDAFAATPALALVSATLRALAARNTDPEVPHA